MKKIDIYLGLGDPIQTHVIDTNIDVPWGRDLPDFDFLEEHGECLSLFDIFKKVEDGEMSVEEIIEYDLY